MTSLRFKVTGLAAILLAAGIALLALGGNLLMEPWFALMSRSSFEAMRNAMAEGLGGGRPDEARLTNQAQTVAAGTVFRLDVADADGIVIASSAPNSGPASASPSRRRNTSSCARKGPSSTAARGFTASSSPSRREGPSSISCRDSTGTSTSS